MKTLSGRLCGRALLLLATALGTLARSIGVNATDTLEDLQLAAKLRYNAAIECESNKDLVCAEREYEAAVQLDADMDDAWNNLGNLKRVLGDYEASTRIHFNLLERFQAPNELRARTLLNLGLALLGDEVRIDSEVIRQSVIPMYLESLEILPSCVAGQYNLGNAYKLLGDTDQAAARYVKVIELDPSHVYAHTNLAGLYFELNNFREAVRLFEKAAELASIECPGSDKHIAMLNNLGQAYRELGDPARALQNHRLAIQTKPKQVQSRELEILINRVVFAWQDWEENHRNLVQMAIELDGIEKYSILPFNALLMPPELFQGHQLTLAELGRRSIGRHLAPHHLVSLGPLPPKPRGTKLRVGYLSYDMREHPMGRLMLGVYINHNRTTVENFVYMYGNNDNSSVYNAVRDATDHHVDIYRVPVDEALARIVSDELDILVDLMGHTRSSNAAIVSHFPAATYVNYLGHPGTSGLTAAGAFALVDRHVLPPERILSGIEFTEDIIYLPFSYQANSGNLGVKFCSPALLGRARFEACRATTAVPQYIPGGAGSLNRSTRPIFRFANFNTLQKMEPRSFSIWCEILKRVPHSVLYLLDPKLLDGWNKTGSDTLREEAAMRGVDPDRILFLPKLDQPAHLNRIAGFDLQLDSFIYGAHSTASDALWSGVPLLTIRGAAFASRVGVSLLEAVGLGSMVANSAEEFIELATELATRPSVLAGVRRALGRALLQSSLFRSDVATPFLEAGLMATQELGAWRDKPRSGTSRLVLIPAPELAPRWLNEVLQQGFDLHLKSADLERAANVYHRVIAAVDMSKPEERMIAANALHLLGIIRSDIDLIRRALGLSREPPFLQSLADALSRRNQIKEAIEALLEAVALSVRPESPNVAFLIESLDRLVRMALAAKAELGIDRLAELAKISADSMCSQLVAERAAEHQESLREVVDTWFVALLEEKALDAMLDLLRGSSCLRDSNFRLRRIQQIGILELQRRTEQVLEESDRALAELYPWPEYSDLQNQIRQVASSAPEAPNGPLIVIFCYEYAQDWWPNWGPRSAHEGGMGGSEEAVVFLSQELVRLGFRVEVYADSPKEDWGVTPSSHGVIWLPHGAFDPNSEVAPDVFVSWRYLNSVFLGKRAKRRVLWMHDLVVRQPEFWDAFQASSKLDRILGGSDFHLSKLSLGTHLGAKAAVLRNGLDSSFLQDGPNLPNEIIYASSPSRGLETLLRMWPRIRSAVPSAVLRIYYGFTAKFRTWGAQNIPNFDAWLSAMQSRIQELDGVVYIGAVSHTELASAYARAGFVVYPTTFSETSCISLMKAMAMGSIPITSRFERSALGELTTGWDLGPEPRGRRIDRDASYEAEFVTAVVDAMQAQGGELERHRAAMKVWARENLTWRASAKEFVRLAGLG